METTRSSQVQRGIQIEILSILWMTIEMGVSIGAGIAARSILLTAFGIDSLIELFSASLLLWRLRVEGREENPRQVESAERKAAWGVAIALAFLCVYVLAISVYGLLTRSRPEASLLGIGISAAAVIIMPLLAVGKRRIADRIHSEALAGDAVNSITCATMAGTVLIGLALNYLPGWWWIEDAAALVFLIWLARETWEAFEEARGKGLEQP